MAMQFDPRTLTPAAVKSMMMPRQQLPLSQSVAQNVAQPMTMEQLFQGQQPSAAPERQVGPTNLAASLEGIVSNLTNAEAKDIGNQVFGPRLANADPDKIITAATDNPDDVDPSLRPLFDANPELMAILGATTKLAKEEEATSNLLSTILKDETTPDEARAEVNKFFGTDPEQETPVWADVAVTVGLSLLRGEGGRGEFLSDLGVAGQRGFAVAKERGKEKRARSDMMNKLAYGVYREDKKQRTALASQLRTNLSKLRADQQKFGLDVAKYLQKEEEITATEAKNRGDAITKTLNTLSDDQKAKAFPIIARNANAFKGVAPDAVASTMFGLLKANGLSLDNVTDAKNIVESSFTITDKETYDRYKALFPNKFIGEFEEGREYKVEGFSDKSKAGDATALTNVLSVQKSVGGADSVTRLLTQEGDLLQAIRNETDETKIEDLNRQLKRVQGALALASERKEPLSYVFVDGKQVAAGPGAAGAYQQADAISKATELSKQGNALASAFGLADGLSRTLASQPTPATATGVFALFGNYAGGVRGQIGTVINAFGEKASDNEGSYLNGDITDSMLKSTERAVSGDLGAGKYSVGQVFKAFEKATEGNTQLRSQLMSFAYALAGSRETGKLTDKDVAAALVTFGGGDIAEGKWFANPDVLITGINQALTTATNDFAVRYNAVHNAPANLKYLKNVEKLSDEEIANRTTFDLNSFLKKNEGIRKGLSDRVIYDGVGIRMQGLDKYRGDGAGNVEGAGPRLSSNALNYIGVLQSAAQRNTLDPSDPNFLSDDDLDIITRSIPAEILKEIQDYRKARNQ